ncbi:MAG: hypothetical protein ACO3EP_08105 [Phycisphaerales bacterium]
MYFGNQNLTINSDFNGLYLNVVTGAYNVGGGVGSTVTGGWHINGYNPSTLTWYQSSPNAVGYLQGPPSGGGGGGTPVTSFANLAVGTLIDGSPSNTFASGDGASSNDLTLNGESIVGFRFNISGLTHYGWFRVSLSGSLGAQPRKIVDWAYEDAAGVGILAGVTPSAVPGGGLASLVLTGFGSAAFRRRR